MMISVVFLRCNQNIVVLNGAWKCQCNMGLMGISLFVTYGGNGTWRKLLPWGLFFVLVWGEHFVF